MQRDDGLARARAARLGEPRARARIASSWWPWIVATMSRIRLAAAAGQRGHECTVADDDEVVGSLGDHEVVLDADDDGAAAAQDAAAQDAHRLRRGRPVEGRRRPGRASR